MPKQEDYDLGKKAIALGLISQDQLEEAIMDLCALERISSKKTLGEVLIKKGFVDAQRLAAMQAPATKPPAPIAPRTPHPQPQPAPESEAKGLEAIIEESDKAEAARAEAAQVLSDTATAPPQPNGPPRPIAPAPIGPPPAGRMKTPVTVPANNASEFCFVQLTTGGQARVYVLPKKPIAIGREPANDIVVLDGPVSKRHARLTFSPEGMTLWDVGSKNGTYVNDEKVTSKKLKEGDAVRVGNAFLLFARVDTPDGRIGGTITPNAPEQNAAAILSARAGLPPGSKFALGDSPLLIGSESPNNICISDPRVSPFHAQIAITPEGVRIVDLNSASGLKVNGETVAAKVLEEGDTISIAQATLHVDMVKKGLGDGAVKAIPATRAPTAAITPHEPVEAAEEMGEVKEVLFPKGADTVADLLPGLGTKKEEEPEMVDLGAALRKEVGIGPTAGKAVDNAAHPGKCKLICIAGVIKAKAFPIDAAKMTFGRNPASDIFLEDLSVSREHAMIKAAGDRLEVVDLGSRNGIEVNGRKVMSKMLDLGDKIKIGKNVFLVEPRT